ncbi:unnamed protein product [Cylicocyclus nassatus]|uniref:Uncharacterized protein n=1 Tax=Cylicocyclus nassatus TaxID=53992 RepID=A0AA36GYH3_CYLNA|nr:unnamed protein product [Cylicocyclus nassatus]
MYPYAPGALKFVASSKMVFLLFISGMTAVSGQYIYKDISGQKESSGGSNWGISVPPAFYFMMFIVGWELVRDFLKLLLYAVQGRVKGRKKHHRADTEDARKRLDDDTMDGFHCRCCRYAALRD